MRKPKYTMENRVLVTDSYECFVIRDRKGARVYAGTDEVTASGILRALNLGLATPKKSWPRKVSKPKQEKKS